MGLEGTTEADADAKRKFVPFNVTPSSKRFPIVLLQGIAPKNSWLGGAFLNDYNIICKIKMRQMKTK